MKTTLLTLALAAGVANAAIYNVHGTRARRADVADARNFNSSGRRYRGVCTRARARALDQLTQRTT